MTKLFESTSSVKSELGKQRHIASDKIRMRVGGVNYPTISTILNIVLEWNLQGRERLLNLSIQKINSRVRHTTDNHSSRAPSVHLALSSVA